MRDSWQHNELAVSVGKLREEIRKIAHCSDAIVLAANEQHGRGYFLGIDYRQVRRHVEVGSRGNLIAKLQFLIREEFGDSRIRGARFITRKDAADHFPAAQP